MLNVFSLKSPLGPNLIFSQATLDESVSGLFDYQIEAVSRLQSLDPKTLLGKAITMVRSVDESAAPVLRYFSGYCTRLEQTGVATPGFFSYRLAVRPWLWFLSRSSDSRIFQNMSIPDILKAVFAEEPRAKFDNRLQRTYEPWEYCVQYRETTLNFVTRLMEQEGIYYFFEHSDGAHKLVLCDSASVHKAIDGTATIPFYRRDNVISGEQHINQWSFAQEIQPGKFSIDEYDPSHPSVALFATRSSEKSDGVNETAYEIYDYPGEYDTEAEGRAYANIRLDELQTRRLVFAGAGDVATMVPGRKFTLDKHKVTEQNSEYFITATRSRFSEGGQEAGGSSSLSISMQFYAIKASQQYRPPRVTPKPIISGVQTAFVTGPAGEEIYTDKQGRVRVRFLWDRYDKDDAKTSCWIRTAMPWASGQFGFMALPRIGDEVVVTFLEGDPDRPLITGAVFNAENKTPYDYPANKTQSGIRTKSSKGAGEENFNEIFFEDQRGSELFGIQAEKDHHILVKNDRIEEIRKDSHLTISGNFSEKIKGKQHLEVAQDQNIKVGATYSLQTTQDWLVKSSGVFNAAAAQEIHLKAGTSLVLEASTGITLKVGGNFVSITPAGVDIKGIMVNINSGGAALSGKGASPTSPDAPLTGKTNKASGKKPFRQGKALKSNSSADTLREAHKGKASFCEICEGC
jgi:type VI secretion system secreted protein VgrG